MSMVLYSCGSCENTIEKIGTNITRGDFVVSVYSGGTEVRRFELKDAYISTEAQSDGWMFKYNKKLVRVSGTVVIEEIAE